MPSATRPCERCQRLRARSVWGPNTPSAEMPSARCSEATPPPRDRVSAASATSEPPFRSPAVGGHGQSPTTASSAASDSPRGEGSGSSRRWSAASRRRPREPARVPPQVVVGQVARDRRQQVAARPGPGVAPARRRRSCERSIDIDQTSRLARSLWTELKLLPPRMSGPRLRGELTGSRRVRYPGGRCRRPRIRPRGQVGRMVPPFAPDGPERLGVRRRCIRPKSCLLQDFLQDGGSATRRPGGLVAGRRCQPPSQARISPSCSPSRGGGRS